MWTSTRGGVWLMWTHVDRERGQKPNFFVDVINRWPLIIEVICEQGEGGQKPHFFCGGHKWMAPMHNFSSIFCVGFVDHDVVLYIEKHQPTWFVVFVQLLIAVWLA